MCPCCPIFGARVPDGGILVTDIAQADLRTDVDTIGGLWQEYLAWVDVELQQRFGVALPMEAILEEDLSTLDKFGPPRGRLLLVRDEGEAVGIGCLRHIGDGTAEIKRMYIRPAARGRGLGRQLLQRLIEEARTSGYERVRLDSSRFMHEAHRLYRSAGFGDIDPYPESEIPDEFKPHWVFLERSL